MGGGEPTEVITRSRSGGIVNRLQLDLLLMGRGGKGRRGGRVGRGGRRRN